MLSVKINLQWTVFFLGCCDLVESCEWRQDGGVISANCGLRLCQPPRLGAREDFVLTWLLVCRYSKRAFLMLISMILRGNKVSSQGCRRLLFQGREKNLPRFSRAERGSWRCWMICGLIVDQGSRRASHWLMDFRPVVFLNMSAFRWEQNTLGYLPVVQGKSWKEFSIIKDRSLFERPEKNQRRFHWVLLPRSIY